MCLLDTTGVHTLNMGRTGQNLMDGAGSVTLHLAGCGNRQCSLKSGWDWTVFLWDSVGLARKPSGVEGEESDGAHGNWKDWSEFLNEQECLQE